jgi:hypothetical protein
MARTTPLLVQQVIETALTTTEILEVIQYANRMVTNFLNGSGLTAAELKDIETFLTAHIIAITKERQTKEERVGDIWVKYYDNPTGWLESTSYGQTAMMMDTSGLLQKQSKKRASFVSINQVDRS